MRHHNHITTVSTVALIGLATLSACGADTDEQTTDATFTTPTSAATQTITETATPDGNASTPIGGETGDGTSNDGGESDPGSGGADQPNSPDLAALPAIDAEPYRASHVMPEQPGYQFVSPTGVYCEMYDAPGAGIEQPLAMCTENGGGDINAVSVKQGQDATRHNANRIFAASDKTVELGAGQKLHVGSVTCGVLPAGDTVACDIGGKGFTTQG